MPPARCCYSCRYWKLASKKVPVDAVKVLKEGEYIEVKLRGRVARIPAWEWKPAPGVKLEEVKLMRVCFYGGRVVRPWDECENYAPSDEKGKVRCEVALPCEYSMRCPKFRLVVSYIA